MPTENGKTIKEIAKKLNIPEVKVEGATQFLADIGLLGKTPEVSYCLNIDFFEY